MQVGDEFVVMVKTTVKANGKTIENPIIRVTRPQAGFNPRFVYFVDNQTVGQPRHWYVGDGKGNVVVGDVDVVDSTTSTALATALTNQLTAAGYLSGTHTGTVNDVPTNYGRTISYVRAWQFNQFNFLKRGNDYRLGVQCQYTDTDEVFYLQCASNNGVYSAYYNSEIGVSMLCQPLQPGCEGGPLLTPDDAMPLDGIGLIPLQVSWNSCSVLNSSVTWSVLIQLSNEHGEEISDNSDEYTSDDYESFGVFTDYFDVIEV